MSQARAIATDLPELANVSEAFPETGAKLLTAPTASQIQAQDVILALECALALRGISGSFVNLENALMIVMGMGTVIMRRGFVGVTADTLTKPVPKSDAWMTVTTMGRAITVPACAPVPNILLGQPVSSRNALETVAILAVAITQRVNVSVKEPSKPLIVPSETALLTVAELNARIMAFAIDNQGTVHAMTDTSEQTANYLHALQMELGFAI